VLVGLADTADRVGTIVVVGVRDGVIDSGASPCGTDETIANVEGNSVSVGVIDGTGDGVGVCEGNGNTVVGGDGVSVGAVNGAKAVNSVKWLTGTVIACLTGSTAPPWIVTHWPEAVS